MQETDFNPDQRRRLGVIFDNIKKCATVSQEERKRKRGIVMEVLRLLEVNMRMDRLFNKIFKEFGYTGSYFDNLRIKDANEFDINIVLTLPVRTERIKLESSTGQYSDFTELRVDYTYGDPIHIYLDSDLRNQFVRLLDSNGRIIPEKVLNWMQSVLAKAFNNFRHHIYQLTVSASGPAKTIRITLNGSPGTSPIQIDVDLVAVFRIEPGQWAESGPYFKSDIVQRTSYWKRRMLLIPKTSSKLPAYMWRKHFPELEEELLNGTLAAKPVIRIMKLLRDNQDWESITSYNLKTLVMIEVDNHRNDPGYWHDSRTPYLVFEMMKKLLTCFREGNLPYLLYRNVNQFQRFEASELTKYANELHRIYSNCVQNVHSIESFFIPK